MVRIEEFQMKTSRYSTTPRYITRVELPEGTRPYYLSGSSKQGGQEARTAFIANVDEVLCAMENPLTLLRFIKKRQTGGFRAVTQLEMFGNRFFEAQGGTHEEALEALLQVVRKTRDVLAQAEKEVLSRRESNAHHSEYEVA